MSKTIPLAFLSALLLSVFAKALPDDGQQPISIKANHSTLDNVKGILTYRGAVSFVQGSISILSDYLEIRIVDGAVTFAEAKGTPATFSQMTREDGTLLTATGNLLRYDVVAGTLYLHQNASIAEGQNLMSGGTIDYQLDTGNAEVIGDPDAEDSRMEIIFVPASRDNQ